MGSSVNLELTRLVIGPIGVTTTVVGTFLLSIAKQTPTSTTALTQYVNPLNTAAPNGIVYTAATLGAAITSHYVTNISVALTSETYDGWVHTFDGELILPPGYVANLVCSAAQTSAMMAQLSWMEWPV